MTDMLARAEQDVIAQRPDWVTLSVGINDVWHGAKGVPIEAFRDRYVELVDLLGRSVGDRLALFTTTVIGEDLHSPENEKLAAYNEFIRVTAGHKRLLLVEMNQAFHKAIAAYPRTNPAELVFTRDGVHMQPAGDCLMALTLLRTWGLV